MNDIYFWGNNIYLPVSTNDLSESKFYIRSGVSGHVNLSDIHTKESLDARVKAGEVQKCDLIIPTVRNGLDYKRVW